MSEDVSLVAYLESLKTDDGTNKTINIVEGVNDEVEVKAWTEQIISISNIILSSNHSENVHEDKIKIPTTTSFWSHKKPQLIPEIYKIIFCIPTFH